MSIVTLTPKNVCGDLKNNTSYAMECESVGMHEKLPDLESFFLVFHPLPKAPRQV